MKSKTFVFPTKFLSKSVSLYKKLHHNFPNTTILNHSPFFQAPKLPNSSSKPNFTTMAFTPPQVNKTDPTEIPSVGCNSVMNVPMTMCATNSAKFSASDFTDCDAFVFATYTNSASSEGDYYNMSEQMKAFDKEMSNGAMQTFMMNTGYQPSVGQAKMMNVTNSPSMTSFGVVGMGTSQNPKDAVTVAKAVAGMISAYKCKAVQMHFPEEMKSEAFFKAFMESFFVATSPHMLYVSNKKAKDTFKSFQSCQFVVSSSMQESFESVKSQAMAFASGIYAAAEMVHAPANYCNTVTIANMAAKIAEEAGMKFKCYEKEECEEMGMGAYLAVCKGSFYPPKFITMNYTSGKPSQKVFFVGKGVVFDSGGYNLKPATGMIDMMKFDMGGAAAVFGAAKAIGMMKPTNCDFTFVVPAAENMISQTSYRPGDVITASNGKTIEVGNTDAEGRLCLCDALVFAEKNGADYIIDTATLTGACMVALGMKYAGMFSNDEQFSQQFKACADMTGEKMWPMPMAPEYKENFSSKIADMNNTGKSPQGGAINAALFLNFFVEKAKWVHIDMAGPVFDWETGTGTGFGVKTLTQCAMNFAQGKM